MKKVKKVKKRSYYYILLIAMSEASHVKGYIPLWAKHTVGILLFTNMLSWYPVLKPVWNQSCLCNDDSKSFKVRKIWQKQKWNRKNKKIIERKKILDINYSGDLKSDHLNLETFGIQTFWRSDFKWSGF